MTDNYVQVPPNSTGLKIDTSELAYGGNTVERQRIVLADPANALGIAKVSAAGFAAVDLVPVQLMILTELRRIAMLLEHISGQSISAEDLQENA
jgi:hypothetical protein